MAENTAQENQTQNQEQATQNQPVSGKKVFTMSMPGMEKMTVQAADREDAKKQFADQMTPAKLMEMVDHVMVEGE